MAAKFSSGNGDGDGDDDDEGDDDEGGDEGSDDDDDDSAVFRVFSTSGTVDLAGISDIEVGILRDVGTEDISGVSQSEEVTGVDEMLGVIEAVSEDVTVTDSSSVSSSGDPVPFSSTPVHAVSKLSSAVSGELVMVTSVI